MDHYVVPEERLTWGTEAVATTFVGHCNGARSLTEHSKQVSKRLQLINIMI